MVKKLVALSLSVLTILSLMSFDIFAEADGVAFIDKNKNGIRDTGEVYETLQAAIEAATNDQTIVVLNDIIAKWQDETFITTAGSAEVKSLFVVAGKALTIDLNGYNISCTSTAASTEKAVLVTITGNGQLTLKDTSINSTGGIRFLSNETDVYALLLNYKGSGDANNPILKIEGGNYFLDKASDSLIYSSVDECVTVSGGRFILGNVGTGKNFSPWIFNASGQNTRNVIVTGGTFNDDINHQYYPFEVDMPSNRALRYDGDEFNTWTVVDAVAYVNEQERSGNWYTHEVGYASVDDAIRAAEENLSKNNPALSDRTVKIVKNITVSELWALPEGVKIEIPYEKELLKNADGTWSVVNKAASVEEMVWNADIEAWDTEEKRYLTLKEAFDAAKGNIDYANTKYQELTSAGEVQDVAVPSSNRMVTLEDDVILTETLTLPAGITLDGNKKTITAANNIALQMTYGVLKNVIIDSSMTANSALSIGANDTEFNMTIENCIIKNTIGDAICVNENGLSKNLVISGCTFEHCNAVITMRSNESFTNNTVRSEKGITLYNTAEGTVSGNVFESDESTERSLNLYNTTATIENNMIYGRVEADNLSSENIIYLDGNYWGGVSPVLVLENLRGVSVRNYFGKYESQNDGEFILTEKIDIPQMSFRINDEGMLQLSLDYQKNWEDLGVVVGEDGKTPDFKIENGNIYVSFDNWISKTDLGNIKGNKGDTGDTGNGISDISKTETNGLVDTYTITYTNGAFDTFTVTNGANGDQGIQGIQGQPGKDGHTPVITIQNGNWYIDGVDTKQAAQGIKGDTGNGISDISKTGTNGLVDTYTITYTNGAFDTFTVTNGANGDQGIQGIQGQPGKDGHTPVITIQNGNWYIDGVDTKQAAQGIKGDTGNGISDISKTESNGLVDTYTITYTNGTFDTFTVTNGESGSNIMIIVSLTTAIISILANVSILCWLILRRKKGIL